MKNDLIDSKSIRSNAMKAYQAKQNELIRRGDMRNALDNLIMQIPKEKLKVLAKVYLALDDVKAADAVPVVHGWWKYIPPRVMEFQDRPVLVYNSEKIICTACEGKALSADWMKFSYCPNCGAKMAGNTTEDRSNPQME